MAMISQAQTIPSAQRLTRKQALAELYHLYFAWIEVLPYEQWEAQEEERKQFREALAVLTRVVYGPPHVTEYSRPCECCYQRYSQHLAHEKGKRVSTWCCTPCRERLQAQGRLMEQEETPSEAEVQA